MQSKKYKLLFLGLFALTSLGSLAQDTGTTGTGTTGTSMSSGSGYDVFDSSIVSQKNMAQQNEFWNNTYNFPAKPRNQMELGISGGLFTISGDVNARMSPGGAIHLRKALGYLFSLRLQYMYGLGKGMNYLPSDNFAKNSAWNSYAAPVRQLNGTVTRRAGQAGPVFYNYRAKVQDLSLQGIFSLSNIRFHKQRNGIQLYAGVGLGATIYSTGVNALNGSTPYTFPRPSTTDVYENRKDVLDQLDQLMDDTYETDAESHGGRRPSLNDNTLRPTGTFLAGLAFKLGKRVNLAIEDRFSITKDDLLDGQRWQEQGFGDASLTSDYDSYNYASVGLNFNLGSKSTEPLYWINPLDYAYSELNNPRHMKLPKPILDDTDGDGVIDQLDREPNTPAGCPVDTHGVTRDSDGDGVPDCRDKQMITPTECQPVDADGVGKCPEPDCCKNRMGGDSTMGACNLTDLPSISFRGNTGNLNSDAKSMLATVASQLKSSADCNITITGYPAASKASQALANRRVDAIRMYLMESEGISGDRITTNIEVGGGDANTVDIRSTGK